MITPYPPPPGPRVELLRVRRVAHSRPVERNHPSPLRDAREPAAPPAAEQSVDPGVTDAGFGDDALRRLAEDLSQQRAHGSPTHDHQDVPHGETP